MHCACLRSTYRCWWCKRCRAEDLKHEDTINELIWIQAKNIKIKFISCRLLSAHWGHTCFCDNPMTHSPPQKKQRKTWTNTWIYSHDQITCYTCYVSFTSLACKFTCDHGTAVFRWNLLPDGGKTSWDGLGLNQEAGYWLDLGSPSERNARVLYFVNAWPAGRADVCRGLKFLFLTTVHSTCPPLSTCLSHFPLVAFLKPRVLLYDQEEQLLPGLMDQIDKTMYYNK